MSRLALGEMLRALPAPVQLLLKRGRASLQHDDWATSIKRLRLQEQASLDDITRTSRTLPDRQRVLVSVFQQAAPWVEISYSLAQALRLRGHDVRGLLCDGLVPICEMNLGRIDRPSCAVCHGWLSRYADAFGFEFKRLTEFLSEDDRDRAERLVEETPPATRVTLVVDGVAVGQLARRELQRYHRGFVFDPASDPAFDSWLVSAILLVKLAAKLLDREQPDIVVAASGRALPSACLCEVARLRNTRVVTWDTEPTFPDGLVFSHGDPAVLIPLDEAWADASRQPLDDSDRLALREFLRRWARSEITPHPYNPAPMDDPGSIRSALGLRPAAPLIVAFGNSAWDMAAVDRDVGFTDMFDWLFGLVEYAMAHPEIDLVVRAHPSETNVPHDLQSRTPVGGEIRKRYGSLPKNIKLVDGGSAIDSYALAGMARVVTTYASRIGLEVALGGKRPWIAGATTYRGKGFTRDLLSKRDMIDLLETGPDDALSPDAVDLAERFAHLWFFRYVTRLPLLRPSTKPFTLTTFRVLAPGGHPVVDRICDALIAGTPFVDLC